MTKAEQVSKKASEDNLKKVVDHGFKPVFGGSCVIVCLNHFLNNNIAVCWGEVDHVLKPSKNIDQVF